MSDVHNDEVKDLLDKNHIQHTEAVMYRTVLDFTPEEEFNYDMLIFFGPAGIQSLMKNFNFEQEDIAIGSFGPTTAKTVKMQACVLIWKLLQVQLLPCRQRWICLSATQQIKIIPRQTKAKQSISHYFRFVLLYTLYERFSKINPTESRTTEQPFWLKTVYRRQQIIACFSVAYRIHAGGRESTCSHYPD